MAVREKTLTRSLAPVKRLPTGSTHPKNPHNYHAECGGLAAAFEECAAPPNSTTRTQVTHPPVTDHELRFTNSLLQILLIPPQNPLQPIHQMLLLPKPMRLPRINYQLRLHSIPLQPPVKLLTLPQRINRIRIPLQHQCRCLRFLQMHEGRAIQKSLRLLPRNAIKPLIPRRMILRPKFRNQIRHPRPRNRRLEHVRLRNRPLRHISAVRPPANPQPIRVSNPPLQQILNARHHILEVPATPIPAIRLHKFLSISHRPANIRIKHRVPTRRQQLPPSLNRIRPSASRPAMNERNQ